MLGQAGMGMVLASYFWGEPKGGQFLDYEMPTGEIRKF